MTRAQVGTSTESEQICPTQDPAPWRLKLMSTEGISSGLRDGTLSPGCLTLHTHMNSQDTCHYTLAWTVSDHLSLHTYMECPEIPVTTIYMDCPKMPVTTH